MQALPPQRHGHLAHEDLRLLATLHQLASVSMQAVNDVAHCWKYDSSLTMIAPHVPSGEFFAYFDAADTNCSVVCLNFGREDISRSTSNAADC